jgi:hypothetical protein
MPYSKDPDSYPPEYLEVFRRGYEGPVKINLPSPGEAISLRHKLHAYRRALVHTSSPFTSLVHSCRVRLDGSSLVVEPATQELRAALASAGVEYDPRKVTDTFAEEEDVAGGALEKLLKEQGFGGT